MKTYMASGVVFGRFWGGGEGSYIAKKYISKNKDSLLKEIAR